MKNIIILTVVMFLSVVSQAQKKLKLGFNTGTISPKALLETEARDGTKFFIDSNDGKVGIGVTAPNSKLVVSGGDQITGNLDTRSNTNLNVSSSGGTVGSGGSLIFSANNGLWNFAGIKGLVTNGGSNSVGHLAFSLRNLIADTTLTERMRILSNGYVGINSTAPLTTLDVKGSFSANLVNISAATYTISDTDHTIILTATTLQSILLPPINAQPRRILVISNPTNVDKTFTSPRLYQDLDGAFKLSIPANSCLTLQNVSGGWTVIGRELNTAIVAKVFPSGSTLSPTGTTPATAIDYMSINIPGAGVWELDWSVRGVVNGAITGIASVLTDNSNVVQTNSEVLSIHSTTTGSAHGTGHGKFFVTTTGAATYKIRIYGVGGLGGFAASDANGRSWVSAKRIQ